MSIDEKLDRAPLITGSLSVDQVLEHLAESRPVFHSEADFQHAFARAVWDLAPEIGCRLEVRQSETQRKSYLDLLCLQGSASTAIEFKYHTRRWSGELGEPPERFSLKSHAATDLARRNFVFDIARLETFCATPGRTGLAIMLTNDPVLWTPPSATSRRTRDHEFRVHEGRVLRGHLRWAEGTYVPNERLLGGRYELRWRDYAAPADGLQLRQLVVEVSTTAYDERPLIEVQEASPRRTLDCGPAGDLV